MEAAAMDEILAQARIFDINEKELQFFQELMLTEAGVTLPPTKKSLVRTRLSKRLHATSCATFTAYCRLLDQDGAERQSAVDLLTTNETYFFREPKHFAFLRESLPAAFPSGRPFRVWSAACSSGEEPYSIAMVLADHFGEKDWSVLGSDISLSMLSKARTGHYSTIRSEGIPAEYLKRYCLRGIGRQEGTLLIDRRLRARVDFRPINLNESLPPLESFDAIFLRNVMIYFSQDTKTQVVKRLLRYLKPGGHFFIGHSESLHGIDHGLQQMGPATYCRSV